MPRTLDDLTWPRSTERLVLGRLGPEDADALWDLKGDPELNRWTTRFYTSRPQFTAAWDAQAATDLVARWNGRVAGVLTVEQHDAWSQEDAAEHARGQQVQLGWRVAPWAQGQGIATELAGEGLAIAVDLGVHRVEAHCFVANTASWKVMEKLGMRREVHTVRESLHRDGRWRDAFGYAFLTEECR